MLALNIEAQDRPPGNDIQIMSHCRSGVTWISKLTIIKRTEERKAV